MPAQVRDLKKTVEISLVNEDFGLFAKDIIYDHLMSLSDTEPFGPWQSHEACEAAHMAAESLAAYELMGRGFAGIVAASVLRVDEEDIINVDSQSRSVWHVTYRPQQRRVYGGTPEETAALLNELTEQEVMLFEHKFGLAGLAELIETSKVKAADAFHEALFAYIAEGPVYYGVIGGQPVTLSGDDIYLPLPNRVPKLALYEQLKHKTEWDEEAIHLASLGDIPYEFLIAKFGNRAEVWQAVDLSAMEVLLNLDKLIAAGVRMEPYVQKLEAQMVADEWDSLRRISDLAIAVVAMSIDKSEGQDGQHKAIE